MKIFRSQVEIIPQGGGAPCYVWPWAIFTGYMGALLDDSITNKVYFVKPNQNHDTLLFDYNLLVEDTIEGMLTANCTMTISSIDSVLVGNEYRKKWNFTTCNEGEGYFIQGIGSDNGLIEWINSWGFTAAYLVCVKTSEKILYETDWNSFVGCVLIPTVEEERNAELDLKFYPNPFSGQTTLLADNHFQNATLTILNSFGQIVNQVQNIYGEKVTISRDNLTCGLYFYQLKERKKTIAIGKLIITDK
jgi:hypothetical protein